MPLHRISINRRLFSFAWPFVAAVLLLVLLGTATQSVMSAVRAYIVGETLWSKGQKDAIYSLDRYVDSGGIDAYINYQDAVRIPLADRRGREALEKNPPDLKAAHEAFLQADTEPSDIPGAIWLLQHFRKVSYLEQAVYYWTEADQLLAQLNQLADEVHKKREAHTLSKAEQAEALARIEYINLQVTPLGKAFSITLAEGARAIQRMLLIVNLLATALLITFALVRTRQLLRQNDGFENALYAEKERAQTTLASIGDAVITTDTNGRVEYLNPVAERLIAHRMEQARGQQLETLFHLAEASHPEQPLLPFGDEAPIPADAGGNLQLRRHDGDQVAVSMVSAPIFDHANANCGRVLVFHDMTREHQYIASLSWQATHDALTGLTNRHEFERRLGQLLDSSSHRNQHHALMYLDLDQFKVVNDTCGHAAGDELLRQVCVLLQQHLRDDDTLARLGGDEFGVLLKNCPPDAVLQVAEKLRQTVSDLHFLWGRQPFSVSVSIGVVHISAAPTTLKEVLRASDVACYLAKEKGRNRVQEYSPGDAELSNRNGELEWVQRLHHALEEERFCLYAQPIVPLAGAAANETHFELLLRLRDEHGALVPPIAFIPAAERYNLMAAIDRWVVRCAFSTLGRLPAAVLPNWQCAINLSGASIGDETFLAFLHDAFDRHGIAPSRICFEITETSAIANLASATRFMRTLRKLGCRFALDDFGAGMSSFGYLKHLPVDYLKIDGGFVKDMLDDPIDHAMVEMINHIGHVMGKRTIAEFVETQAIAEALQKIGVDYAQGYGVAQPLPLPDILTQAFGTPLLAESRAK